MGRRIILTTFCLALASTALFQGVEADRANAEEARQSPAVTGNFRDPGNVPKKRSITRGDREAAARRLAEGRAAALKSRGNTTSLKETPHSREKGVSK